MLSFTRKTDYALAAMTYLVSQEGARISAREIAEALGLTSRAVEKQIAALKAAGRLRRVGPAKGGHWEVVQ